MTRWLDDLDFLGGRDQGCILVTVAEARGSTPRETGTKMVVSVDAIFGTIGGGQLEYEAARVARELLAAQARTPELHRFGLGPALGQCCGGVARVLFEPMSRDGGTWQAALREPLGRGEPAVLVTAIGPAGGKLVVSRDEAVGTLAEPLRGEAVRAARMLLVEPGSGPRLLEIGEGRTLLLEPVRPGGFDIVLFGAGHVGKALVRVLGELPCRVTWVDGRAEQYPESVPANVTVECTEAPVYAVGRAPQGTAFLVMTHSHALDLRLCEKILRRNDFSYFGLIGSATKRATFIKRFKARGIPQDAIDRMVCPIGIPGVSGKHPGEIAVAVAAQLLQVRESPTVPGRAPEPAPTA